MLLSARCMKVGMPTMEPELVRLGFRGVDPPLYALIGFDPSLVSFVLAFIFTPSGAGLAPFDASTCLASLAVGLVVVRSVVLWLGVRDSV